jgi:hypothetical protein
LQDESTPTASEANSVTKRELSKSVGTQGELWDWRSPLLPARFALAVSFGCCIDTMSYFVVVS